MSAPNILVVDDSSTIRVQLRRMLTKAGFHVLVAGGGPEGLELAQAVRPDLIVLDIQMPGMDGYGVCQELKRMGEPWSGIPIVFLTSLQSHALDLLGSEMGAYIRKPVDPERLLTTIDRFLLRHQHEELPGAKQHDDRRAVAGQTR